MAETKKSAPETEELRKSIARFTKQGDRGTALVAAAWLDDALELMTYFVLTVRLVRLPRASR
jgi:hypothetical protein